MTIRSHILIAFVVVLAVGLTLFKIPLASSQGLTLIAAKVTDDLPATDAASALWQKATAIEVPLSAQSVVRPLWPEAKVKSVVVRALYNEAQLAFLIEWADETQNDSMVRIQDFRDAVALQFPLVEGPPLCMGQQGGNVNIWHWKADWQADIAARQDVDKLYPNMYA
ncbi:MAG: ethylbenzene dehydrogenase-related protein [Anaerolineae bacterium]